MCKKRMFFRCITIACEVRCLTQRSFWFDGISEKKEEPENSGSSWECSILKQYRSGQAQWCLNYHRTASLELPAAARRLLEVTLQQTLQCLAVAGLIMEHINKYWYIKGFSGCNIPNTVLDTATLQDRSILKGAIFYAFVRSVCDPIGSF